MPEQAKPLKQQTKTRGARSGSAPAAQRPGSRPALPASHPLELQRSLGNRAVEQLLTSGTLQAKLTVSRPGDRYEQEADRVADAVMRMREPQVQRQSEEDEEEELLQPKPVGERITPLLQRQICPDEQKEVVQPKGDVPPESVPDIKPRLHALQNGGRPLSEESRSFFEPRFGRDFGNVRIHTGSEASRLAGALHARAFTTGNHIVFGESAYAPGSSSGKQLLGHELTHVIQQGASRPHIQRRLGDGHDLEADRFRGVTELEQAFDNERLVRKGAHGPYVEVLQQALVDAGCPLPVYGVDGKFGNETKTAVETFQSSRGLTGRDVDGIVGPITMGLLDREFRTRPHPPTPLPHPPTPRPPATISSETVVTDPSPRTRTTIGVGEEVDMTHSAGSVPWSTSAGTLSAATGTTVRLTAPDTAQTVTVTAGTATKRFTVIAPNGIHMDRFPGTGIRHTHNQPDSGIQTRPFLLPDTVNFSNVQYREVDVPATASGPWTCHIGVGHDPHPATLTCSDTVIAGKGTRANARDTVYSGHCGGTPPFTPGHITFNIPNEYKVGSGSFHRFTTVTQQHTLAADASTCNTDKAGAHADVSVTDPTSSF
jgi:peptidoglycan hydrolase-like protein with peptidoglycan-binding domain